MAKYPRTGQEHGSKFPPPSTPEGSINQMASLALTLAEKRLRNGTASAQEIVYFAKEGSPAARTEREILGKQKELISAKTDALRSGQKGDELYDMVIAAMKKYSGGGSDPADL